MAELISNSLRWFLNSESDYCVAMEKTNSRLVYLNNEALQVNGFKDLSSAEGREIEEIRSPMAKYAPIFREQNHEVMATGIPREYFDTHFCTDKKWHCWQGIRRPFYSDDDNDALDDRPYTDDDIAGVIYHGIDISAPHTIDLASVLAHYWISGDLDEHIKILDGSYEINCESTRLQLKDREAAILYMANRGSSNSKIGNALHLSERTIDDYINALKVKMGVDSRSDLTWKANISGYHNTIPREFLKDKQTSIMLRECLPDNKPWWFFEQLYS